MRIYISGPITGIQDYRKNFDNAEKYLKQLGWCVFNPAKVDDCLEGFTYDEFLSLDIYLLDKCDAIYLLKGWTESKGAKEEVKYAIATNKKIFSETENNIVAPSTF